MCLYIWLNKYEYKMESSVFSQTCKEVATTILTRKTAEQTEIQRFLDPLEIAVTGKTAQWYILLAIAFPQKPKQLWLPEPSGLGRREISKSRLF